MNDDPMKAALDRYTNELHTKDVEIERLKRLAEMSVTHASNAAVLQAYVREVSVFHREALLPLLDVVKKIMERVSKEMPNATDYEASIAEIKKYLTRLEERAKGFEQTTLVDKARQSAIDEQKKLEGNKEIKTGEPPRHGSRCFKTLGLGDCNCALSTEAPP